jgi:putative phosphoesterase
VLRPEAVQALQGCDRIIHAGDIGDPAILEALDAIAPVDAVRGNNDRERWAQAIDDRKLLTIAGIRVLVLHDAAELRDPAARPAVDVVVSGHSHVPAVREENGILFVNPGSAGPRRFKLPVSVGFLEIRAGRAAARLVTLL